jgi:hypothetical protein
MIFPNFIVCNLPIRFYNLMWFRQTISQTCAIPTQFGGMISRGGVVTIRTTRQFQRSRNYDRIKAPAFHEHCFAIQCDEAWSCLPNQICHC